MPPVIGREHRLAADLRRSQTCSPSTDREAWHRLGLRGRELDPAVHPERRDPPGVSLPGAIRFVRSVSGKAGVARAERRVVDRVAGHGARRPGRGARCTMSCSRRRRVSGRQPRRSGRCSDVHAEVAHHADLAAVARLALPVDRLAPVEVARVQEGALHLDDLAERARSGSSRRASWAPGKYGISLEQRTKTSGCASSASTIRVAGGEVDPERLLRQEVLAGRDRVEVELLVEVVGHGEVEDVDVGVVEQVARGRSCAGGRCRRARTTQRRRVRVATAISSGAHGVVLERRPAPDRRGQLAAHQAAADDADADRARSRARQRRPLGVAPSCTTAISARIMPAGPRAG